MLTRMSTPTSPWKLLFSSRKFTTAYLTVLLSAAVVALRKVGVDLNVEETLAILIPLWAGMLTVIFGITLEDAALKKSAALPSASADLDRRLSGPAA